MTLQVKALGQRDPQWASKLLGFNTDPKYTIGNYGCLITCLASYVNKTPHEVNEILKANSGFVSGGLFVWSKCTALGLNQTYSSPTYDGPVTSQGLTKIKDLLSQGCPPLCEIDFNPSTVSKEQHYVLLVGFEGDKIYAMDPWTAQIVDLDVYGGPTRAIIQFRAYDKKLEEVKPINIAAPAATDQTKLLIDGKLEEWQAIRSELLDKRKTLPGLEAKAKQLDGFLATWETPLKLVNDPQKPLIDQVGTQLSLLLEAETNWEVLIGALEPLVGAFDKPSSRLEALQALKNDIERVKAERDAALMKLDGRKVLYAIKIWKFLIKVYGE